MGFSVDGVEFSVEVVGTIRAKKRVILYDSSLTQPRKVTSPLSERDPSSTSIAASRFSPTQRHISPSILVPEDYMTKYTKFISLSIRRLYYHIYEDCITIYHRVYRYTGASLARRAPLFYLLRRLAVLPNP